MIDLKAILAKQELGAELHMVHDLVIKGMKEAKSLKKEQGTSERGGDFPRAAIETHNRCLLQDLLKQYK